MGLFILIEVMHIFSLSMNKNHLLLLFLLWLNGSMQAQEVYYLNPVELIESELSVIKNEYFRLGQARSEIILIDFYKRADTNCYRFTSSINALEILARKPCAYIIEPNLMIYIFCDDTIMVADTLMLGKVFDQSLKALQLPSRAINWKENAYFDCSALYEWTRIFDPFIIEYRYLNGRLIEEKFQDKMYYKRLRPKCILTEKFENKCNCK